MPVSLLPPPPGAERALDACAAPGGKSAQIALAMGGRGTLVANDRSAPRTRALRATIDRLGLTNVAMTQFDAARLPDHWAGFDYALVDAPCSCEGTSRKRPDRRPPEIGDDRRRPLVRAQRAILARAVDLARPGASIVYSTCTYAPEENEGVIDWLLGAEGRPGAVELAPIEAPPGLPLAPGVTRWLGRDYHPSVAGAARLWPQTADTGGFFVAALRKI